MLKMHTTLELHFSPHLFTFFFFFLNIDKGSRHYIWAEWPAKSLKHLPDPVLPPLCLTPSPPGAFSTQFSGKVSVAAASDLQSWARMKKELCWKWRVRNQCKCAQSSVHTLHITSESKQRLVFNLFRNHGRDQQVSFRGKKKFKNFRFLYLKKKVLNHLVI